MALLSFSVIVVFSFSDRRTEEQKKKKLCVSVSLCSKKKTQCRMAL